MSDRRTLPIERDMTPRKLLALAMPTLILACALLCACGLERKTQEPAINGIWRLTFSPAYMVPHWYEWGKRDSTSEAIFYVKLAKKNNQEVEGRAVWNFGNSSNGEPIFLDAEITGSVTNDEDISLTLWRSQSVAVPGSVLALLNGKIGKTTISGASIQGPYSYISLAESKYEPKPVRVELPHSGNFTLFRPDRPPGHQASELLNAYEH